MSNFQENVVWCVPHVPHDARDHLGQKIQEAVLSSGATHTCARTLGGNLENGPQWCFSHI